MPCGGWQQPSVFPSRRWPLRPNGSAGTVWSCGSWPRPTPRGPAAGLNVGHSMRQWNAASSLFCSAAPPQRGFLLPRWGACRPLPPRRPSTEAIEAATTVSRGYRQLWLTTPAEDLRDLVLGHLRLIARLLLSTTSEKDQARLTSAASETALLAAWLAEDLWDLGSVNRHYQEARTYAERSQDDLLRAYVEGCKSYWATRTGHGTEAVKRIEQAKRFLPRHASPAVHTWIAAREATSYAAAHDEPAMSSALIRAETTLDKTNGFGEPTWPWIFPIDDKEISRYRGFAAVSVNLPAMAVPALTDGLEYLGPAPTKRCQGRTR